MGRYTNWLILLLTLFILSPQFAWGSLTNASNTSSDNPFMANINPVGSQSGAGVLPNTVNSFGQLEVSLLNSADPKVRSFAATDMGGFHYEEAQRDLVQAIINEIENKFGLTNTFVVGNAISSLMAMANQSLLSSAQQLKAKIEAIGPENVKLANPKTKSVVLSNLTALIAACPNGPAQLPSLLNAISKNIENASTKTANGNNAQANGISTTIRTLPTMSTPVAPTDTNGSTGVTTNTELSNDILSTTPELIQATGNEKLFKVYNKLVAGVMPDKMLSDSFVVRERTREVVGDLKGRDKELEQVDQALQRIDKGHVLLMGKAGVGKTTLVKMLVRGWYREEIPAPGNGLPPLVFELPITDLTNQNDPTELIGRINAAKTLAAALNRHIVIFYDESHVASDLTRNALKSFLTEPANESMVHLIWATTSQESRSFLHDTAFSRRWTEVFIPEFNREQSIDAVKSYYLPQWQSEHAREGITLEGISTEAYETAYKYSSLEQPHAGNPTGLKELLEGAIIYKLHQVEKARPAGDQSEIKFTVEPEDIRNYLKFQKGILLLPGDASFDEDFNRLWSKLESIYVGNEAFLYSQKQKLHAYFSNLNPKKLTATVLAGPPGAGKSYYTDSIAKVFFNTKPLVVNGADLRHGDLSNNKLTGSVTGTVGSEEQRSMITKYIRDNPQGGVIVIREADFAHIDVYNWLADMITSKEFTDGLGQQYRMDRYLFYLETNIGQDYQVASERAGQRMTWNDLEMRQHNMFQEKRVDGKVVEVVRPDILDHIFESFVGKINKESDQLRDSAMARESALKLKRRLSIDYVSLPTRGDLIEAANVEFKEFQQMAKTEYKVDVTMSPEDLVKLLDLDKYNFTDGYTWVVSRIDDVLVNRVLHLFANGGKTFHLSVVDETAKVGSREVQGMALKVDTDNGSHMISLGITLPRNPNPWFSSPEMMERIRNFKTNINKYIMGEQRQKAYTEAALKQKALNWNTRIVITQIGTSGNGKSEFAYGLGQALFGTRDAVFKISGIQRWGDLHRFFRSDVGFVGSTEETEFERWFMARKRAGGGVILLDELLSFDGLNAVEVSEKINAINKIYDMLDSGEIRIGGRTEDATGFITVVTGNALQNLFNIVDDSPEAEQLVKRIIADTTESDIERDLAKYGLDAPKIARLGKIFLNGPLASKYVQMVGRKEIGVAVSSTTAELRDLYSINVVVDPAVVDALTSRVTTVRLGMRKVNAAIDLLIKKPIAGILYDRLGVQKIEAKLVDGQIEWFADGQRVEKFLTASEPIADMDDENQPTEWQVVSEANSGFADVTPQLKDVESQPKIVFSPDALDAVARHELYGHWMSKYLLTGENPSEFISLVPTSESLGYVRPKDKRKQFDIPTLSNLLVEVVSLEAGHRSVFLSNRFAVGGGTSEADASKLDQRNDDLAKVERTLNQILSNNLIDNAIEFGNERDKALFKSVIRGITKRMADRVVEYGLKTNDFYPLFEQLKKDRFLNERALDEFSTKLKGRLERPDILLVQSLTESAMYTIDDIVRMNAGELKPKEKMQVLNWVADLINRVRIEQTRSQLELPEAVTSKINDLANAAIKKIHEKLGIKLEESCSELLIKAP